MIDIHAENKNSGSVNREEFEMKIKIEEIIRNEEKKEAQAFKKCKWKELRSISIKLFALRDRLGNSIV